MCSSAVAERFSWGSTLRQIRLSVKRFKRYHLFRLSLVVIGIGLVIGLESAINPPPPLDPSALYVAPDGDDTQDGAYDRPFLTLRAALRALPGGGTLYIRAGTYTEAINNLIPGGTPDNPTMVAAFPGEDVRLYPPETATRGLYFAQETSVYIVVDGLIIDAARVTNDGVKINNGAHHITLQNCEIMNAPGHGVHISRDTSQYNRLIGVRIHDNGIVDGVPDAFRHGVYIQASYNQVVGATIYANGGNGVQIRRHEDTLPPIGNQVRDSRVYAQDRGVVVLDAVDTVIINNIFDNNDVGVQLQVDTYGTQIWNNTFYANRAGIVLNPRAGNPSILNNLIAASTEIGVQIPPGITFAAFRANLIADNAVDVTPRILLPDNRIGAAYAPALTDPAAGNFRLSHDSAAINAGTPLPDGALEARARGVALDIGALEFP